MQRVHVSLRCVLLFAKLAFAVLHSPTMEIVSGRNPPVGPGNRLNEWSSYPIHCSLLILWVVIKEQARPCLVWPAHLPASRCILFFPLRSSVSCSFSKPPPAIRLCTCCSCSWRTFCFQPLLSFAWSLLLFHQMSVLAWLLDARRAFPDGLPPVKIPRPFLSWHSLISVCLSH